jgi:hypothetical protein
LGILATTGIIPQESLAGYLILGELSLDGRVKPVMRSLSMALVYGIFVVQQFLRYLFHIQIYNSRDFKKSAPLYVVSSQFCAEL